MTAVMSVARQKGCKSSRPSNSAWPECSGYRVSSRALRVKILSGTLVDAGKGGCTGTVRGRACFCVSLHPAACPFTCMRPMRRLNEVVCRQNGAVHFAPAYVCGILHGHGEWWMTASNPVVAICWVHAHVCICVRLVVRSLCVSCARARCVRLGYGAKRATGGWCLQWCSP